MKRLVAVLPIAAATAGLIAPAVSSSSGTTVAPAKKQTPQMYKLRTHSGPCPFAASTSDV
jgi:hypothetical protein